MYMKEYVMGVEMDLKRVYELEDLMGLQMAIEMVSPMDKKLEILLVS